MLPKEELFSCAFPNLILTGLESTLRAEAPKALGSLWLTKAKTKRILTAKVSGGEDTLIDDFGRSKRSFCFMFVFNLWVVILGTVRGLQSNVLIHVC